MAKMPISFSEKHSAGDSEKIPGRDTDRVTGNVYSKDC
jgi:hypothetical protein